jgi:hypothetical protein
MWEDAAMHHPQTLAFASVYDINVRSTIAITGPHTINPSWLIKAIHSGFKYFSACCIELPFKEVLYFY